MPSTSVAAPTAAEARSLPRAERSRMTAELLAQAAETDDSHQRDQLLTTVVELNVRIAHAVAARYRGRDVALEDLEQVACEGLVKAVQRFDPAEDRDLLSYAVPTIRGELLRHFRDRSWMVRPPRRLQELQYRLTESEARLASTRGQEVSDADVAADLEVEESAVREARRSFGCFNAVSLDQLVRGGEGQRDGLSLGGTLPEEDEGFRSAEARVLVAQVLPFLGPREQRLLHLRFWAEQTQSQIGSEFGMTQVQVSRWLVRVCEELRGALDGSSPTAPVVSE